MQRLRHDAQHAAVAGRERNAPIRCVQRAVGARHEPTWEAGEPGQHLLARKVLPLLEKDPLLQPIRQHPHYQVLLNRVGLDDAAVAS